MHLFVINPHSGNGNGLKVWSRVERECINKELDYVAYLSQDARSAAERVKQHLTQYTHAIVVIIGGDGTIHQLLPVIVEYGGILAVIPAGSGNDTARGFGIPMDPVNALRTALKGNIRSVDMMQSHEQGEWTLTALATGFDSAVADAVNRSFYKRWCNRLKLGPVAYLIGIVHTLFTFKPTTMTVHIDDSTYTYDRIWLAAISNVNSYGGGIRICPEARADDGLLDICLVHGCSKWTLLRLLPTVFTGKHVHLPQVVLKRGKKISIQPAHDVLTIGDGEPIGSGRFEAKLLPEHIRMCIPH